MRKENTQDTTLDDLLLLSRSTLPAQRASMLQVLARVTGRLVRNIYSVDGFSPLRWKPLANEGVLA